MSTTQDLNTTKYQPGTVGYQVKECGMAIEKNIAEFGSTSATEGKLLVKGCQRGLLSQNILQQLRNLVESIAVGVVDQDGLIAIFEYEKVRNAINECKRTVDRKFIADFHDFLQRSVSHYTLGEDGSERLMLKYYEYLLRLREYCLKNWNLYIVKNLEKFPLNLDNGLQEYYEKIARKIQTQRGLTHIERKSRYYIDRIRPIFVEEKIYYEVTFHNALNYSNKTDRLIGFTNLEIADYYAAKLEIKRTEIEVHGCKMPITIITDWEVSIRPCEINNFFRVFYSKEGEINANNSEYKNLMEILTKHRMSLVDLIDLEDYYFDNFIASISASSTNNNITYLLKYARHLSLTNKKGANVIRYLMLRMNNKIIKGQYDLNKNKELSELFLSNGCIPFDTMPLCTSLKGHNPRLSDILRCISSIGRECELLNRIVKNNIEQKKMLYTPIGELEAWLEERKSLFPEYISSECSIEELIEIFNGKIWRYHCGRKMNIYKKHVFIAEYDGAIEKIIGFINKYTVVGDENFDVRIDKFMKSGMIKVDDPRKKDALSHVFRDSKVSFIYGAAGTGKTTMIDLVSKLYRGERKLFLAHTHPAVENLRRRVEDDGYSTFSTISKWITESRAESYSLLVIDECSTVSNRDFLKVLENVSTDKILLVGDLYQIDSIQFGNWFDISRSFVPQSAIFELVKPYRTSNNALLQLWSRVRDVQPTIEESLVRGYSQPLDLSFFEVEPNRNDEIILCLNYDGLYGINNINRILQDLNINPAIEWNSGIYKIGDPVVFLDVDRFKPVIFNNLKGNIVGITPCRSKILFDIQINRASDEIEKDCRLLPDYVKYIRDSIVRFTVYRYDSSDVDMSDEEYIVPFQVAYAISIHKSQGLEYDSVKILVTADSEDRISHNIFYTAITRARRDLAVYWSPESENKIITSFTQKRYDHKSVNLLCQRYSQLSKIRERVT